MNKLGSFSVSMEYETLYSPFIFVSTRPATLTLSKGMEFPSRSVAEIKLSFAAQLSPIYSVESFTTTVDWSAFTVIVATSFWLP